MLLSDIAAKLGIEYSGNGDCDICTVATLKNAGKGTISFLANPKYKYQLDECNASAVIVHPNILHEISASHVNSYQGRSYLLSENPYLVYAKVSQLLYSVDNKSAQISPQAIVHQSCEMGENCHIASGAVIGKKCVVGDGVSIGSGVVVGEGTTIGTGSKIFANVTIYHECNIGSNCLIHSGAVVGSDGFGFALDKGEWVKIQQVGKVIIGDNVEIGANTTIDRGAIDDTVIENGVKLDNQIQVAHNVRIGKNTAIAGGTAIAGSSTIGAGCTIAGMVGITGHLSICDNVHITAQSLVTKSIEKPGAYSSSFAADHDKSWKKKLGRFNRLESLFARVKKLEKLG
ncbi:MAG: UDP-3-O-(3-hydroxymyristoyl)glucosamine N-acyltransferase [Gammaproteobacteria bacterium]|nr:MAG: UDP-3-O-(3-hydroxymyristoyl)glucosamine N-acyltransferase [Gammaproteobacteria bacterium]